MLSTLYPIGFTVSLIGLILWFYFEENRKLSKLMSVLFLGGFFVYLFSFFPRLECADWQVQVLSF